MNSQTFFYFKKIVIPFAQKLTSIKDFSLLRKILDVVLDTNITHSEQKLKNIFLKNSYPFYSYLRLLLKSNKDIEKDKFIEFDTEFNDDNIEKMHYEEHQKISAKEFMEYNEIEEEMLEEIDELLDEFYAIEENELDEYFIEKFLKIIQDFIHIFNLSIEFKDIAYSLEKLYELLIDVNLGNKDILKSFLISIIDDLAKFKDEVFVNKSAVDIHYMDASLLANVAQLEIMLNQKEDNEIEFF